MRVVRPACCGLAVLVAALFFTAAGGCGEKRSKTSASSGDDDDDQDEGADDPADRGKKGAGASAHCTDKLTAEDTWKPGNVWVFHVTRDSADDRIDEVAPIDYFARWEVQSATVVDGKTTVIVDETGGPMKARTREFLWDGKCLQERVTVKRKEGRKKIEEKQDQPRLCLSESDGPAHQIGSVTMKTTATTGTWGARLAAGAGLVHLQEPGNRKGTERTYKLIGLSIGECTAGDHDKRPIQCDWDQLSRGRGKRGPGDLPSRLESVPGARDLMLDGSKESRVFKVKLSGAQGAKWALAATDGHRFAARIPGAPGAIGRGIEMDGYLRNVKSWQHPDGDREVVQFFSNDDSFSRVHFYELSSGRISGEHHIESRQPGPTNLVAGYISSAWDKCIFMLARKYKGQSRAAVFDIKGMTLQRLGGSLSATVRSGVR